MAKKCGTFWDQWFSRFFYLVILENDQKVQKKWCLRVLNWTFRNGLIYTMISTKKWLFWPRVSFCPLNGTGNTNKPLKTHGLYLTQDPKSTKFEPFRGFLGLGLTLTKARNGVKNRLFGV